ncbi:hypothetical protein KVC27_04800 [Helicobacter pylori]|nr:hypothetical protein KVC27_04800 [Helicobacter pylori]
MFCYCKRFLVLQIIGFVALAALVYYLWGKWEKLLWGVPSNQEQQLSNQEQQLSNQEQQLSNQGNQKQ